MNKTILSLLLLLTASAASAQVTAIKPGTDWKDTKGTVINAHGGCVQYDNGYYYWVGEQRNGGKSDGISCYRSADLMNWERLSRAVTPTGTKTDENRDIAQGRTLERPKMIYNDKTGKWVMWIHWENGSDYGRAQVAVLTADQVQGPYTLVDVYRPNGCDSRDQTLFKDADGTAYHVYSTNMNTNTNCERLADDYLTPLPDYNQQLRGRKYEAASLFRVGGTYYSLFSGCTGWDPNPGRMMWTNDLMGEWTAPADYRASDGTTGTNFCVDKGKDNSYKSQPAYVFPVQGRDRCFIYAGDRWVSSNVQKSTYIWLPLSVRSGYPAVRWYDQWDMSVFDDMYRMKRIAEPADGIECSMLERYSNRFVSRPKSTLTLDDDGDTNLRLRLHATATPHVFRIEDLSTGRYMESVFGTVRWQDTSDDAAQQWRLELQEDGYYNIVNLADNYRLSVSGNGTEALTPIYLSTDTRDVHQSFAFYYDSTAHPDYTEADMWSATYRADNRRKIEEEAAAAIDRPFSHTSATAALYDLAGQRLDPDNLSSSAAPHRLVIERRADGTVRKVLR